MYKLRTDDGKNNYCGRNLKRIRDAQNPPMSQRALAQKMQNMGYDIDHHVIRRIETGERFVTDIELKALSQVLKVSYKELID